MPGPGLGGLLETGHGACTSTLESGHCAFHLQGSGRAATEPHPGGAARRSLRSGHGSEERGSRSRQDVEMKGVRLQLRELEAGCWFTSAVTHHGTWGLRRWMIGCSTIAFTPTPMGQVLLLGSHALAGVILGRSRRPLSSRCRCPSAPA